MPLFQRLAAQALVAATIGAALGCGTDSTQPSPPPPPTLPLTGTPVPQMVGMDHAIAGLMEDWRIPGGAVAVTYQGRLVYARGFGYADTLTKRLVDPTARFRIASVSKPITATAIMTLVEAGKLTLTDHALSHLDHLRPPPGTLFDPRLDSITVAQLLYHTAGWDASRSGDPFLQTHLIATTLGIPGPPSGADMVRYMLRQPLDFRPGTRYAYANIGFATAGRVIESVSGQPYEAYVKGMLARAGITRMEIAHTRRALRPADEVSYYDPAVGPSVFSGEPDGPFAETGVYFEGADAAGGWIASVVDIARFLTAMDGSPVRPDLLTAASITTMLEPPPRVWDGSPYHYALGWLVRPAFSNWWHDGSTPGTASFAGRIGNDVTIVAVFNAREMVPNSLFQLLLENALGDGLQVTAWPSGDQFAEFP